MSYSSSVSGCNMVKNYQCQDVKPQYVSCSKPQPQPQPQYSSCGCNSNSNNCSDCSKYKDIANKKCEQATYLSNEASQIANKANQLEEQAKILACEANDLWKKYDELSDQSVSLMEEAKMALDSAIQCYKKCQQGSYNPNLDCNFNNGCNSCNSCSCGCNIKPQPRC